MISQQQAVARVTAETEAYIITCLSATAHHAALVRAAQVLTCCHGAASLLGHTGQPVCHALTQEGG